MIPADIITIVNGGGTLALALIVWLELRQIRTAIDQLTGALAQLTVETRVDQARDELTPRYGIHTGTVKRGSGGRP